MSSRPRAGLCDFELFFVVCAFVSPFSLPPTSRISNRDWTHHDFTPCTSIFRTVTWRLIHSSYMWLVRPWQALGLVRCSCCSSLWRSCEEEGGSCIKAHSQAPDLHSGGGKRVFGLVNVSPRDLQPLYLPTTGVYFPTLYRPSTRTL